MRVWLELAGVRSIVPQAGSIQSASDRPGHAEPRGLHHFSLETARDASRQVRIRLVALRAVRPAHRDRGAPDWSAARTRCGITRHSISCRKTRALPVRPMTIRHSPAIRPIQECR